MPRQKKKHHARRIIQPTKAHRNKILNRNLDEAYKHFGGSKLYTVLERLREAAETSLLAEAYLIALQAEIANRRAKKHKGDMQRDLYSKKTFFLYDLIHHCLAHGYRIEQDKAHDVGGPSKVLYCYLPGCEQLSWHCSLTHKDLPDAVEEWDGKNFSTLRKIEAGLKEVLPSCLEVSEN